MNGFNLPHACKPTDANYKASPVPTRQGIASDFMDAADNASLSQL